VIENRFEIMFRFTDTYIEMSPSPKSGKEKKKLSKSEKAERKASKIQKRATKNYLEYAIMLRGLSADSKIHPVYYNEVPSNNTIFIEWSDGEISNFRKCSVLKLLSEITC